MYVYTYTHTHTYILYTHIHKYRYFGCRNNATGGFCPDKFRLSAALPQVKMIEIKLSQGAKPSHGGILPKSKISAAIAEARGIPRDQDCNSPPNHQVLYLYYVYMYVYYMYVCTYVCIYVCMDVCMYVYMYIYTGVFNARGSIAIREPPS